MKSNWWNPKEIKSVLITEQQIKEKVKQLGDRISDHYRNKNLLVVGILKGSVIFTADLIRQLTIPVSLDFMAVSSYGYSAVSGGEIRILKNVGLDIKGMDILIVEDIIDSGITMSRLVPHLLSEGAADVKVCSLLSKPDMRQVEVNIDYLGFSIPPEFVVGYGLDYAENYRNLPFIGILNEEFIK